MIQWGNGDLTLFLKIYIQAAKGETVLPVSGRSLHHRGARTEGNRSRRVAGRAATKKEGTKIQVCVCP